MEEGFALFTLILLLLVLVVLVLVLELVLVLAREWSDDEVGVFARPETDALVELPEVRRALSSFSASTARVTCWFE